jgi:hypothetical protein
MDDGAGGASGIAHVSIFAIHTSSNHRARRALPLGFILSRPAPPQAPSVALHLPTQLDADADFVIPKPPVPNVRPCPLHPACSSSAAVPSFPPPPLSPPSFTGEPVHPVRSAVAAQSHRRSGRELGHATVR